MRVMTELNNVIPFRQKPQAPKTVAGKEGFTVNVNGSDYFVEKAFLPETGHGFGKVVDGNKLIMMYPTSSIPDAFVGRMIMAWRTGYSEGFHEGTGIKSKGGAQ
jgi:hypothetical protein